MSQTSNEKADLNNEIQNNTFTMVFFLSFFLILKDLSFNP